MKYAQDMPKSNLCVSEEVLTKEWVKIKRPKISLMSLLVIVIFMIANTVASIIVLMSFTSSGEEFADSIARSVHSSLDFNETLILSIFIISIMLVHKILHIIFIPGLTKASMNFWKINLFHTSFFTKKKVSKVRYNMISSMPLLIISVILPTILGFFNLINGFTIFIVIFNAMFSSVDILDIYLITIQTPKNCYVIRNQKGVYFKQI